jgi:hypothetical protein
MLVDLDYVIWLIVIWFIIGILFLRKELKSFFFSEQDSEELPEDGLMGTAHDVFQIEKQVVEGNIVTRNVLSEDDFEVEYDNIEIGDATMFNDGIGDSDSITPDKSIIGFKEMQQMVAVVESDKPLQDINSERIAEAKRIIKQVKDTDFYEKMTKIREDISRRIDEIQKSI